MRVLVACEFSGIVRDAFRRLGHDAWSCDLLPCERSDNWHFQRDVRDILEFGWDLLIAHPPCTYLASSGLHWNKRVPGREQQTEDALRFVKTLIESSIPHIALENPIGCISTRIRKPDQIIQPWMFGEDASKATCLWLKNLPCLEATECVVPKYACRCGARFDEALGKYGCPNCCGSSGAAKLVFGNQTPSGQNKMGPSEDRWKERSRTYPGIAAAMAAQWGDVCQN